MKDNKLSWKEAETTCKREGGDLASVPDEKTNDLFSSIIGLDNIRSANVFIGGLQNPDGNWHWTDGTDWNSNLTRYLTGEENEYDKENRYLKFKNKIWYPSPNTFEFYSKANGYICQRDLKGKFAVFILENLQYPNSGFHPSCRGPFC